MTKIAALLMLLLLLSLADYAVPRHQRCRHNPCRNAICPAYPNAYCYLINCIAKWYVSFGRQVNCDSYFIDVCPPGTAVPMCASNPCFTKSCPRFPRAKCYLNMCKGCTIEWRDGIKTVDCYIHRGHVL